MRRLLVCSTAFLAITALISAKAQDAPKNSSTALAWDVVSVKPNNSLDPSAFMRMMPDGVELRNMTLHAVFLNAFEIKAEDQIVGYPSWVSTEHFDIQAKMDTATAAAYDSLNGQQGTDQWHSFMRQILEERFGMKYHREQRELPVYNLVIARQGVKLKESTSTKGGSRSVGPGRLTAARYSMSELAFSLSGTVDRIVIDKTGLTGAYDFALTWSPDNSPDAGPSIFTALQEQLGLKLESAKAPIDVVVIDHLERPSEN
ncbi:MAG TPA: TIGR03435 family protein [Terracidiphilus sp.]|jgi:uncharacterized protein (TIGR03435 family)|nr:TIGR03435 family protein [Terracidiphilus sp.]